MAIKLTGQGTQGSLFSLGSFMMRKVSDVQTPPEGVGGDFHMKEGPQRGWRGGRVIAQGAAGVRGQGTAGKVRRTLRRGGARSSSDSTLLAGATQAAAWVGRIFITVEEIGQLARGEVYSSDSTNIQEGTEATAFRQGYG